MSYIPGIMPGVQVLWQPVIIQPIQNQTIQQLRKQNQMLKSQLQNALKIQSPQKINHFQDIRDVNTDRYSHPVTPLQQCHKQNSQNGFYSPRFSQNHQRIHSNHSPRLRDCLSPNQPFAHLPIKESTFFINRPEVKRMVISKGKDGKFYRDKTQQNQYANMVVNQSAMCRLNTADTANNSPTKTPLKRSHFPNTEVGKVSIQRLKSPSFLKNRQQSKNTADHVSFANFVNTSETKWNESCFKRTPPTHENCYPQQKSEKSFCHESQCDTSVKERTETVHRQSVKIPTVELSVQCDSELSIERMVRDYRLKKKKHCDTFLFEIEKQLDGMYGK